MAPWTARVTKLNRHIQEMCADAFSGGDSLEIIDKGSGENVNAHAARCLFRLSLSVLSVSLDCLPFPLSPGLSHPISPWATLTAGGSFPPPGRRSSGPSGLAGTLGLARRMSCPSAHLRSNRTCEGVVVVVVGGRGGGGRGGIGDDDVKQKAVWLTQRRGQTEGGGGSWRAVLTLSSRVAHYLA